MLSSHRHVWFDQQAKRTLIMLHGTGGDEQSLLPLAGKIDEGANVLAVRGNVMEQGMARYFRRLREGVFDMEDMRVRCDALADWLVAAQQTYGFDAHASVVVGYSNGANTAVGLLAWRDALIKSGLLSKVALLRPMLPQDALPEPDLTGASVLVSAGLKDSVTPVTGAQGADSLIALLKRCGTNVERAIDHGDHALNHDSLRSLLNWYAGLA